MLAFHGSRDKVDFDFVGYNSRLDELQAAFLRIFLEQLDGWNRGPPRGRRAVRRARPRRARRAAAGRAGPRLPPLRLPLARARPHPRRARARPASARATYYTTPLHLQPALRFLGYEPGSLPETERVARGELLRAALARHAGRGAGARRRRRALRGRRRRRSTCMTGIGRHRLLQLLVDAAIVARRVVPRVRAAVRPGPAGLLRHAAAADDPARRRHQARGLPRCSASTAAGGGTSRCATCGAPRAASSSRRSSPYVTVYFVSPVHNVRLPRSVAVMDLLITLALDRGCAPARAHGDRAARAAASSRAARRCIVVGAGDAGRLIVQEMQRSRMLALHADRLRRRRPAQAQHAHPRRARARHDGGAAAHRPRASARRGADRDPVRLRRDRGSASSSRRRPPTSPSRRCRASTS